MFLNAPRGFVIDGPIVVIPFEGLRPHFLFHISIIIEVWNLSRTFLAPGLAASGIDSNLVPVAGRDHGHLADHVLRQW